MAAMANMDIRQLILDKGIRFWEVAEKMGIADGTLSKKLRRELSPEEKRIIRDIIEEIAKANIG